MKSSPCRPRGKTALAAVNGPSLGHAANALPTICEWEYMARAGCALSYGHDLNYAQRRVGEYVARILKGASPSELPVPIALTEPPWVAIGVTVVAVLLLTGPYRAGRSQASRPISTLTRGLTSHARASSVSAHSLRVHRAGQAKLSEVLSAVRSGCPIGPSWAVPGMVRPAISAPARRARVQSARSSAVARDRGLRSGRF